MHTPRTCLAIAAVTVAAAAADTARADIALYGTPYSFVEVLHMSTEAPRRLTHVVSPAAGALELDDLGLPAGARLVRDAHQALPQAARWPAAAEKAPLLSGLPKPAGWLAILSAAAVLGFIFIRRALSS
jgi:hypothetical protein